VLKEVELLVARRGDEVLAFDLDVLASFASVCADGRQRGLPPERRVGQHHRPSLSRIGDQRVAHLNQ